MEDLLAGTGLAYDDLRAYLYPKLSRRGYADETLRSPAGNPGDAEDRRLRPRPRAGCWPWWPGPGESLTRHRAVLRQRVRDTLFDEYGRFRPTEERRRRWDEHRRATMAG